MQHFRKRQQIRFYIFTKSTWLDCILSCCQNSQAESKCFRELLPWRSSQEDGCLSLLHLTKLLFAPGGGDERGETLSGLTWAVYTWRLKCDLCDKKPTLRAAVITSTMYLSHHLCSR